MNEHSCPTILSAYGAPPGGESTGKNGTCYPLFSIRPPRGSVGKDKDLIRAKRGFPISRDSVYSAL